MGKKALGKGIDALFAEERSEGAATAPTERREQGPTGAAVVELPLDAVQMNPGQPRKRFDEVSIYELADSIKRHGVLQPIIVRPSGEGKHVILAGERRYRAARLAGVASIPALVKDLDDAGGLQVALVENLQREDLSPIDEARAFQDLMDIGGLGQEGVAETVGKSRSAVANSLRLLKLPAEMQEAVARGEMSAGHGRALLAVEDPTDRKTLFEKMRRTPLSVREAEEQAAKLNRREGVPRKTPRRSDEPNSDRDLAALEARLLDRLSTKVRIRSSGTSGRIEIHYFSSEDLERVIELLLGS